MRVLVTSPPAVGHIHTMIPPARALQARGHEVRWATGADHAGSIERAGVPAVEGGHFSRSGR